MEKYYYGIKEIEFVWNGEWSDPTLIYKGQEISWLGMEDALYNGFLEDGGEDGDYEALAKYISLNKEYALEIADYLYEQKIG